MMAEPLSESLTLRRSHEDPCGIGVEIKTKSCRSGLMVSHMVQGGPAARSGRLQAGDVITAINGIDLTTMSRETAEAVMNHVTGDEIHVRVEKAHTREAFGESPNKTIFSSFITKVKNLVLPERVSEETQTSLIDDELRPSHSLEVEDAANGPEAYLGLDVKPMEDIHGLEKMPTMGSAKGGRNPPLPCDVDAVKREEADGYGSDVSGDGPLNSTPDVGAKDLPEQPGKPSEAAPKTLRFLLDESKNYVDTLHMKAVSVNMDCSSKVCRGSIMAGPPTRPDKAPRPKAELLQQAKAFIEDYYASIKRKDTPAHLNRWTDVINSIEQTGTYELTSAELSFGAKAAWRNAPRCIGRIQWSKLQIFDARHMRTTRQMFEALCTHIKYATNKGFLRSAITVFHQRTDGQHDFIIWNPQLIRYAGYRNDDGTVLGDPASIELAEMCVKLGWKPPEPRSPFDILPLILQADGQDPDMFEIPRELVLEVEITHPRYPGIGELGLRWYAVPAVANMMLDCGGLEFTGAPFSGWYMASEIATRDICEVTRLNMIKPIAEKIGLDTNSSTSLWKDVAMTETNVAVLYSFQKKQVTITDHHSAAESFMKHLENETELRGGCPADWVWIVPPISGALTPVFHQEMLNYKLRPSYEYQDPEPWKTHQWKKSIREDSTTSRKQMKKLKFKELANAVKLTAGLMKKAMNKRIKCTILFATETGRSQRFAKQLSDLFQHSFDTKVVCMQDYNIDELQHESLVLVVASTFANGDPPDNGAELARSLYKMAEIKPAGDTNDSPSEDAQPRAMKQIGLLRGQQDPTPSSPDTLSDTKQLANVRFSVFALGSSAYPNYCAFGSYVDKLLALLGGERINPCGQGDELHGQEESFKAWSQDVYKAAQNIKFRDSASDSPRSPGKKDASGSPSQDREKVSANQGVGEEEAVSVGNQIPAIVIQVMSDHGYCQLDQRSPGPGVNSNTHAIQDVADKVGQLLEGSGGSSFLEDTMDSSSMELDWYDMLHREFLLMREAACDAFCLDTDVTDEEAAAALQGGDQAWAADRFRLTPCDADVEPLNLCEALSHIHNKKVTFCKLVTCEQLQSRQSERRTILCRFDNQGSPLLSYQPGDHLAIFPTQPESLVNAVLDRVTYANDVTADTLVAPERVELEETPLGTKRTWSVDDRLPTTTLRQALSSLLDLTSPPSQGFLQQLAKHATSEDDISKITLLANDAKHYEEWKYHSFPNTAELLQEFPSVQLPATFLLTQLPLLQQRFYSISSSPDLYPGEVHATVSVVVYRTKGGQGPTHEGVCSSWLNRIAMDTLVPCFIRKAAHFHLPRDPAPPVILVGPGTGVAPFRAFWQQRLVELQNIGPRVKSGNGESRHGRMSLYFGCRNVSVDNLYQEEKAEMERRGVLNEVHLALSREPGVPKAYVQDMLKCHSVRVYHELVDEGGHLYVCGDVSMAADVCKALEHILQQEGNMAASDARGYIMMMREKNRFHEDIFGVTLKTSEIQRSAREQAKLGWKRFADTSRLLVPVSQRKYSLPSVVMQTINRKPSAGLEVVSKGHHNLVPMPMTLRRYSQRPLVDHSDKLSQLQE